MMPAERIQKLLAAAGLGSRRSTEALITAGRVTVDGRVAMLGERADPALQRIEVDRRPLPAPSNAVVWMLNKPTGYVVSAADERGRPTIYDLLSNAPARLRYVGRLDIDSEGLLLLTTDGELAHRLAHPRYEVWKTYEADVERAPSAAALEQMQRGVLLEDGWTAPARVELLAGEGRRARVRLAIREGRKREVRRMLAAVGHPVRRLVRTQVGDVRLGPLAPGASRPLTAEEERSLRVLVGLVDDIAAPSLSSATPRARPRVDPSDGAGRPVISSSDYLARSIAIDGPTASGKSVVGRTVAEALGIGFVDTGLMYRACTLAVLDRGIDPQDQPAVIALVQGLDLDLQWPELSQPHVYLGGQDVTSRLRTPEIERTVSHVSGIPQVRDELVRRQRALAERSPIVMAGRDIGTRVLTEARTKVFLEASTEVRARRRLGEELDAGRQTTFERVLEETRRRDDMDDTGQRAIRREQAASDAIIIDTDLLGIDEVVQRCIDAYRTANGTAAPA
jgi:23S rRNA pseudouridine2605 synthase